MWQAIKAFLLELEDLFTVKTMPQTPPQTPPVPPTAPPGPIQQIVEAHVGPKVVNVNSDDLYDSWDIPAQARHNVRALCDLAGLSLGDKNIITACIARESGFDNNAKCENKDATGKVWSTDWSLVQCNDFYHIGPNKDFPSVEYVLANPAIMVNWMIQCMKEGRLNMWVSYSSGIYKRYL